MKAERIRNAWHWLLTCSDPLLLAGFRHKDGFQMHAWREWRLDCLLRGLVFSPDRKIRSIAMPRSRARAYRRRRAV